MMPNSLAFCVSIAGETPADFMASDSNVTSLAVSTKNAALAGGPCMIARGPHPRIKTLSRLMFTDAARIYLPGKMQTSPNSPLAGSALMADWISVKSPLLVEPSPTVTVQQQHSLPPEGKMLRQSCGVMVTAPPPPGTCHVINASGA